MTSGQSLKVTQHVADSKSSFFKFQPCLSVTIQQDIKNGCFKVGGKITGAKKVSEYHIVEIDRPCLGSALP